MDSLAQRLRRAAEGDDDAARNYGWMLLRESGLSPLDLTAQLHLAQDRLERHRATARKDPQLALEDRNALAAACGLLELHLNRRDPVPGELPYSFELACSGLRLAEALTRCSGLADLAPGYNTCHPGALRMLYAFETSSGAIRFGARCGRCLKGGRNWLRRIMVPLELQVWLIKRERWGTRGRVREFLDHQTTNVARPISAARAAELEGVA